MSIDVETYEKWLTADQASAALKKYGIPITPATLRELARRKRVPGSKINNRVLFRLSALLAHFEPSRASQD